MKPAVISPNPCPCCGCHLRNDFECGCGACKDTYCANCQRWSSLPNTDHIELGPYDIRCESGPNPHEHSEEDQLIRLQEWLDRRSKESV